MQCFFHCCYLLSFLSHGCIFFFINSKLSINVSEPQSNRGRTRCLIMHILSFLAEHCPSLLRLVNLFVTGLEGPYVSKTLKENPGYFFPPQQKLNQSLMTGFLWLVPNCLPSHFPPSHARLPSQHTSCCSSEVLRSRNLRVPNTLRGTTLLEVKEDSANLCKSMLLSLHW